VKPQPPPSLLLGLEPVQSCLGVARVMSNYGYKQNSVPVIFEPLCILRRCTDRQTNVKFTHRLFNAYFFRLVS